MYGHIQSPPEQEFIGNTNSYKSDGQNFRNISQTDSIIRGGFIAGLLYNFALMQPTCT